MKSIDFLTIKTQENKAENDGLLRAINISSAA